ncbi:MAG: Exodeoxyribonuclease VII small subunit [Nitrospira sp.]|jgi:exodeoxyribonuclease VII small subunit|nr:MAG: Exodeoxyribonuclease VII small subunit [Nitrospira sp.]
MLADGRPRLRREASESVSAPVSSWARRNLSHPPRAALAALTRWYVEPLGDARTPLADFFSILLKEIVVAGVKFEQAMARLEAIVGELEKGDLPLDESLKIFEEGIRLSKNCLRVLEEAERKVEVLVQDKNGKKQLRAFTSDDIDVPESAEDS